MNSLVYILLILREYNLWCSKMLPLQQFGFCDAHILNNWDFVLRYITIVPCRLSRITLFTIDITILYSKNKTLLNNTRSDTAGIDYREKTYCN